MHRTELQHFANSNSEELFLLCVGLHQTYRNLPAIEHTRI